MPQLATDEIPQNRRAKHLHCTCAHSDDVCPACYAKKRAQLQEKLWEAHLNIMKIQEEMKELEEKNEWHIKNRPG
ncbi:MAG TPA: hypothetical protein PKL09_04255 [bacterium]|nr:hypothetical protein [bacterium]HNW09187.1 hypothetical protein [bacterium]HNZ73429.1 hypothetical protein [bacterium]HOH66871.1 hypothetical protein [bacterium]HPN81320.1 hypothetical protein [bacterium]